MHRQNPQARRSLKKPPEDERTAGQSFRSGLHLNQLVMRLTGILNEKAVFEVNITEARDEGRCGIDAQLKLGMRQLNKHHQTLQDPRSELHGQVKRKNAFKCHIASAAPYRHGIYFDANSTSLSLTSPMGPSNRHCDHQTKIISKRQHW
uniref:Uncharacterized protein n=1 Tax=Ascaris lumbricoides TaxID=6252 RepID=A0A0M3HPI3_ASCLU